MTETAMDTHSVFKKLTQAGFDERQAEAVTDVMAQRGASTATKADVEAAEQRLNARIDHTAEKLSHKITYSQLYTVGIVAALLTLFRFI